MAEAHALDGAIVIVGPTASGKTTLALDLAERVGGEIIGADSQQVYADLPITTCQPTAEQRARVPHHMIGFLPADEVMSAARYGELARRAAADIRRCGRQVLLVGGTGLYIRAAVEGLFEGPAANPELRSALEREAEREGRAKLHARLAEVDPEAAARLSPNDLVRVIRALEIHELTGETQTAHHRRHRRDAPAVRWYGIDAPREELLARIERRTDEMFSGLVAEARSLRDRGLEASAASRGLGIAEALRLLAGEITSQEAVELTVQATRRYAKRQITWFRKEKRIRWLSPGELAGELAAGFLDRRRPGE